MKALDVKSDGQGDVGLPHGTKEGTEVDQPIDFVIDYDFLEIFEVQHVGVDVAAYFRGRIIF